MNEMVNVSVGELQHANEYLVFNDNKMNQIYRIAEIMATGKTTIPAHLRASPGDCMAVCLQAAQWEMNPFAVAQKTHLVNGTLGYEAQLVIAVINTRAPIKGRMKFEWEGEWTGVKGKESKDNGLAVTCSATFQGDSEPTRHRVSMAQAGVRNSPLWEHDPKMQLAYLCAKRWARLYCPDVILGVYTPDELEQIVVPAETTGPARPASAADLNARLNIVMPVEAPPPPADMNPETGEVADADPIGNLMGLIGKARTLEELEVNRPAVAKLTGDQKLRATEAWKAAKARISES